LVGLLLPPVRRRCDDLRILCAEVEQRGVRVQGITRPLRHVTDLLDQVSDLGCEIERRTNQRAEGIRKLAQIENELSDALWNRIRNAASNIVNTVCELFELGLGSIGDPRRPTFDTEFLSEVRLAGSKGSIGLVADRTRRVDIARGLALLARFRERD